MRKNTFYLQRAINSWWELSAACIIMFLLDHSCLIIISCKIKSVLGGNDYLQALRMERVRPQSAIFQVMKSKSLFKFFHIS